MKHSRVALWLIAILLLLGQQASLLHHLGHAVNDVAHLVTVASAVSEDGTTPQPQPEPGGHVGNCPLCIGFGAIGASVPVDLRFNTQASVAVFARPLGESCLLSLADSAAKPIRGPPAHFSRNV